VAPFAHSNDNEGGTVAAATPLERCSNLKAAPRIGKTFATSLPDTLAGLAILLSSFHRGGTILIPSLDGVEL
jgi:hypothetical protein